MSDIPEFDIYCGGFPCQPFSVAGQQTGVNHKSGDLFHEGVLRIIKYHRPKVVFLENVVTILSPKFEEQLHLRDSLEDLGYEVFISKLNSKYFGVSQNRNRGYIVCFRQDINSSEFSFPVPDKSRLVPIGDILDSSPIPGKYYITDRHLAWQRRRLSEKSERGRGFGYDVLTLDRVGRCLMATNTDLSGNWIYDVREHEVLPGRNRENVRKLTPTEAQRLQGFPDSYDLSILSDTQRYARLGNFVTVPVIRAIAEEIRKMLTNE